nr:unnamed protein product [Callosobruchus analis]
MLKPITFMIQNSGKKIKAGIKSAKTHIRRVVGDQILTYEELQTLLVQVEAVLNSRPLTPLSADPNDLNALTPGHFLTQAPLDTTGSNLLAKNRVTWKHLKGLFNFHTVCMEIQCSMETGPRW